MFLTLPTRNDEHEGQRAELMAVSKAGLRWSAVPQPVLSRLCHIVLELSGWCESLLIVERLVTFGVWRCWEWTKEAGKADALHTLNAENKGYFLSIISNVSSRPLLPWMLSLKCIAESCKNNSPAAGGHGANIIMRRYFWAFTKLHYLLTKIRWK